MGRSARSRAGSLRASACRPGMDFHARRTGLASIHAPRYGSRRFGAAPSRNLPLAPAGRRRDGCRGGGQALRQQGSGGAGAGHSCTLRDPRLACHGRRCGGGSDPRAAAVTGWKVGGPDRRQGGGLPANGGAGERGWYCTNDVDCICRIEGADGGDAAGQRGPAAASAGRPPPAGAARPARRPFAGRRFDSSTARSPRRAGAAPAVRRSQVARSCAADHPRPRRNRGQPKPGPWRGRACYACAGATRRPYWTPLRLRPWRRYCRCGPGFRRRSCSCSVGRWRFVVYRAWRWLAGSRSCATGCNIDRNVDRNIDRHTGCATR